MKDPDFIALLQEQAKKQSDLDVRRVLPRKMDALTSFIGNYPWQVILTISLLGALAWEWWN